MKQLMRTGITVFAIVAATMTGPTAVAQTQIGLVDTSSTPRSANVGLTISGGVSLGAYQAGYLYLTSTLLKDYDKSHIRLVTGASAGSANALITLINVCSPELHSPETDLGWRSWVNIGYKDLFQPEQVTESSIFTQTALHNAMDMIFEQWAEGLPQSCDVVLGVSATRVEPLVIRLDEKLGVPRQQEAFLVRVRGRGPGVPPKLTNYVDPSLRFPQPVLALVDDRGDVKLARKNFDQVSHVLFASGAFPVAFPPQHIDYCMVEARDDGAAWDEWYGCAEPTETALFIDGGVFDNNPLRLAYNAAKSGLRRHDGKTGWRDLTDKKDLGQPADMTYVYVDPDTTSYPPLEDASSEGTGPTTGLLAVILDMSQNLVSTARAKELYSLLEQSVSLHGRMNLTVANYPMASSPLGAFMGFFERKFRVFDFYLGMYDALLEDRLIPRGVSLEKLGDQDLDGKIDPQMKPLACLVGWYSPDRASLRWHCEGEEMRDFRTLLQVSLEHMYSQCRNRKLKDVRRNHHCSLAARGRPVPVVADVSRPDDFDYLRGKEESHFDHHMRLLAEHKFWFEDLGLNRDEAEYGRIKIRRKLLKMLNAVVEQQETQGEQTVLLTAGRMAVNQIAYEPPKNWMYVTFGEDLELGGSFLPFDWNSSWARLHAALQFRDFFTVFSRDSDRLAFSLTAGPEIELLFLTNAFVQPMVGVRGGLLLSTRDHYGTVECDRDIALGDKSNCSQGLVQAYFAVAIIERIRLQLVADFFFIDKAYDAAIFKLRFGLGVQFF